MNTTAVRQKFIKMYFMFFIFTFLSFNINAQSKVKHVDILETYANIALANYTDALNDAKALKKSIKDFTNNPTADNMDNAKVAWLNARESYGQTEAFRLSNGPIDAEEGWQADKYGSLEGQMNAWPLDENMIDYTIDANYGKTKNNIINSRMRSFNPGGEDSVAVDISRINKNALAALNENGGDANVTTGYHAIEFLLWGQDQDYNNFMIDGVTNGALQAGSRPVSDFDNSYAGERRKDYLNAAADLLVDDLETVTSAWSMNDNSNYRAALLGKNYNRNRNIDSELAMAQILSGIGVFIKSELANERIAVSALTPSEEDEHSCFSDNTHRDIAANYQGFKNILMGTYAGVDYGYGFIDAVEDKQYILNLMSSIESKISQMDKIAEVSRHFDYQIRPNDPQLGQIIKMKNEMRALGDQIVLIAKANNINLNIEDVTDNEETKI